ncbi:MAG: glycosyltransferase [Clostridia bacterium]|nr:glycosyltransferase [Clostridia bacterium]
METNKKSLRVAIFTDSFYPGVGGTERAVFEYAKCLSNYAEVAVFVPSYHREDKTEYPFKVYRSKSIAFGKNDIFALPKLDKRLKKNLLDFNPNIIHTQTPGMMADFANKMGKKLGVPVVCTIHTKYRYCYEDALPFKFMVDGVIKRIIKRVNGADRLLVVSNSMGLELNDYGSKLPFTVIKNGCLYKSESEFVKPKNTTFNLLYLGLVAKRKNIQFSLKSLALLKEKGLPFTFNVVGRGADTKYFKKLSKKLGISNFVFFHGEVKGEKKKEFYKNADLFLFPSIFDSDGLVMLEAGAFDTPSLVLKGTGASERIIDNETGFVSKQTEKDFADKIEWILLHETERLKVGKNAKNNFTDWENTVSKYLKVYAEEINKKELTKNNL